MKSCLILLEGQVSGQKENGETVSVDWRVVDKGKRLGLALEFFQQQLIIGFFLVDSIIRRLEEVDTLGPYFVSVGYPGKWELVRISPEEVSNLVMTMVENLDQKYLFREDMVK